MKTSIQYNNTLYQIDLSLPLDISIALSGDINNPVAWYMDQPQISPVVMDNFIGSVSKGNSSTNFNNIYFNPHAHGTHTECLGHITHDFYSINDSLNKFFFFAQLVSFNPQVNEEGDMVITLEQVKSVFIENNQKAFVIRTLPNDFFKKSQNYSHTNPCYLHWQAAEFLVEKGIEHLLIDLPSVDKEKDEGKLLAHKAFWRVFDTGKIDNNARIEATITEMIFVEPCIEDDFYFLNIQIAPFVNDASPSKPILYKLIK